MSPPPLPTPPWYVTASPCAQLGAGYSTSRSVGEILTNSYACLPSSASTGAGVEFVISARASVANDGDLVGSSQGVLLGVGFCIIPDRCCVAPRPCSAPPPPTKNPQTGAQALLQPAVAAITNAIVQGEIE